MERMLAYALHIASGPLHIRAPHSYVSDGVEVRAHPYDKRFLASLRQRMSALAHSKAEFIADAVIGPMREGISLPSVETGVAIDVLQELQHLGLFLADESLPAGLRRQRKVVIALNATAPGAHNWVAAQQHSTS